MTRDQIIAKWDGLSPRERDAWVAEVVLDNHVHRDIFGDPYDNYTGDPLPRYTEDISAAWEVVKQASFGVLINYSPVNTSANFHRNGWSQYTVCAPTAPEAIGLAAIIAKLAKVSR